MSASIIRFADLVTIFSDKGLQASDISLEGAIQFAELDDPVLNRGQDIILVCNIEMLPKQHVGLFRRQITSESSKPLGLTEALLTLQRQQPSCSEIFG